MKLYCNFVSYNQSWEFFILECIQASLKGDGFCNDETNNAHCEYDGGDCCGSCVIKDRCSKCLCFSNIILYDGVTNPLINNGFCNDETNIADCQYDGGDCCGPCVNKDHCLECLCFHSVDNTGWLLNNGPPNFAL